MARQAQLIPLLDSFLARARIKSATPLFAGSSVPQRKRILTDITKVSNERTYSEGARHSSRLKLKSISV
jgi:hypothetical protein